jgi:hypothetical protein
MLGNLFGRRDGRWAGFGSSNGTIRQYTSAPPQIWSLINNDVLQMYLLRTLMADNQILTSIWKAGCIMQSSWYVSLINLIKAIANMPLSTYSNLSASSFIPMFGSAPRRPLSRLNPPLLLLPPQQTLFRFPLKTNCHPASHSLRTCILYLLPSFRTLYAHQPQPQPRTTVGRAPRRRRSVLLVPHLDCTPKALFHHLPVRPTTARPSKPSRTFCSST